MNDTEADLFADKLMLAIRDGLDEMRETLASIVYVEADNNDPIDT